MNPDDEVDKSDSEPEEGVPIVVPEHQNEAYWQLGEGVLKGFCYTGSPEKGGVDITKRGEDLIAKCWESNRLSTLSGLESYLNLVFREEKVLEQMDYFTEALRLGNLFIRGNYTSKEKQYHFLLAAFLAKKSINMGLLTVKEEEDGSHYFFHRRKD